jgi:hypothetical protein
MSNVLNVESVAKQLIRTRMVKGGIMRNYELCLAQHLSHATVVELLAPHLAPHDSVNFGCRPRDSAGWLTEY